MALVAVAGLPAIAGLLRWHDPLFLLPAVAVAWTVWQLRRMDPAGVQLRCAQGRWWIRDPHRPGLHSCQLSCRGRVGKLLWLQVRKLQGEGKTPLQCSYVAFADAFSDRQWRLLRRELKIARRE